MPTTRRARIQFIYHVAEQLTHLVMPHGSKAYVFIPALLFSLVTASNKFVERLNARLDSLYEGVAATEDSLNRALSGSAESNEHLTQLLQGYSGFQNASLES